jgi:hypothetical protein
MGEANYFVMICLINAVKLEASLHIECMQLNDINSLPSS